MVVGFETYHMRGQVTTTDGGWTAHSWVGVKVAGKLVYLDANLPGRYGAPPQRHFVVTPANATFYRNAVIEELDLNPNDESLIVMKIYDIPADLLG